MFARSETDTPTVTDSATILIKASDTPTITDSALVVGMFARSETDTPTVTDSATILIKASDTPTTRSLVGTISMPGDACIVPSSGDWIITSSCTLSANDSAPANVIVQNNSILTIPNGITLDMDFVNFNLAVESGSGVLIESGGVIA
jgi:hypothetical protein